MEPVEPEIPMSSGFSWLKVTINFVSSSEIFSIWCRNPWGIKALSSLSNVNVLRVSPWQKYYPDRKNDEWHSYKSVIGYWKRLICF